MGLMEARSGYPAVETRNGRATPALTVRPTDPSDYRDIAHLASENFRKDPAAPLMSRREIDEYRHSYFEADLAQASRVPGTQGYAVTRGDEIVGVTLLRPRANNQLEVARFLPTYDPSGDVHKELFGLINDVADGRAVTRVKSLAVGASRLAYEQQGFSGETTIIPLRKRGDVVVFQAESPRHAEDPKHTPPDVVIAATTSKRRLNKLGENINPEVTDVFGLPADERKTPSVIEAAESKVFDAAKQLGNGDTSRILIIAGDVMPYVAHTEKRYGRVRTQLEPVWKPTSSDPRAEVIEPFKALQKAAAAIDAPPMVVLQGGMVIYDHQNSQVLARKVTDATFWIKPESVAELATPEGAAKYMNDIYDITHEDPRNVSPVCFQVLLERGDIAGINGIPEHLFPVHPEVVEHARQTALYGMDVPTLRKFTGITE
jgi:hypothetical protein